METYQPTTWSRRDPTFDFVTPSGQTCLLRNLNTQDFVALGMLDEIDELTKIAGKHINDAEGKPNGQVIPAEMNDPKVLSGVFSTMDKLLIGVVVRPRIVPDPDCVLCGKSLVWHSGPEADHAMELPDPPDGAVYPCFIELVDKMAIIVKVTAPISGLVPFRSGQEEGMGDMESVQELSDQPQPIASD